MWSNVRYYTNIYLEGLRKSTKDISQDVRCPNRDMNRSSPEYKSEVLPTEVLNFEEGEYQPMYVY